MSCMMMLNSTSLTLTLWLGRHDFWCNKLGSSAAFVFSFKTILIHVDDIKAAHPLL